MGARRSSDAVERVVIAGAGDCGTRVALELREQKFEGSISLVGEEHDEPYERPALSKDVLVTDAGTPRSIATGRRMQELHIDWHRGVRAVRIDAEHRAVVTSDGFALQYDRLLIATGARARRPAVAGGHIAHCLRNVSDATALRRRLASGTRVLVIGGGFIGLEVAASAIERGCNVTVVEFAHRLMSRVVPAPIAQVIQDRHIAAGCDLRLGVSVERLVEQRGEIVVDVSDGTTLVVDLVVAGVGAIPNTELAATAGLAIANGIAVDDRLRTSDRSVYAAGDCSSVPHPLYNGTRVRLEAWRNAVVHAEVVAANLLGDERVFDAVPWFWSDQYDLGLQIAGLHAAATSDVARRRPDGSELRFGLDALGRIVSASGVAPGTSIARDIRIAELLIASRATPEPADLSNPSVNLRSLVAT